MTQEGVTLRDFHDQCGDGTVDPTRAAALVSSVHAGGNLSVRDGQHAQTSRSQPDPRLPLRVDQPVPDGRHQILCRPSHGVNRQGGSRLNLLASREKMGNMSAAGGPHPEWDDSYTGPPPPWDIGRPQPAFVRLAEAGALSGALLDAGCGTGEHTILAARQGARALGIDVSPRAIETRPPQGGRT